jgi:hypothetical protein
METSPSRRPQGLAATESTEQDWLFAIAFFRQIEAVLAKVAKQPCSEPSR